MRTLVSAVIQRVLEVVVDALPARLWRLGNLYMLPGGDWHFCVGPHRHLRHSVRTVEWRRWELAYGRSEVEAPIGPRDGDDMGKFRSLGWWWGYYPGRQ